MLQDATNNMREQPASTQESERPGNASADTWNPDAAFAHIAVSLARGYTDLYYVNMLTDEFIEYHTDDANGVLTEARRGADFFEGCERDAKLYVHPEDQAAFVEAMNQQFLMNALDQTGVFELVYRRIKDGVPFYVQMRASRMEDDDRIIVIAVEDIDEQVRQRRREERLTEERIAYTRLSALTGDYVCVYVVDPETGLYHEFGASVDYLGNFDQPKEGADFFTTLREAARFYSHPGDVDRVMEYLTQETIIGDIERTGLFTLDYRILVDKRYQHFQIKAAMVEEEDGPRLIVGLNDIDALVHQRREYGRRLARAKTEASIDALTGIKNKHAYIEAEERLNRQIESHRQPPFAIVILDVNDLKKINDTSGHQFGDQYLQDACKIICDTFKRSPVFRVGGDEFAVISRGKDYERIDELLRRIGNHNVEASHTDGVVIACGMSKFDNDPDVSAVFERADKNMYENKKALKSMQNNEVTRKYAYKDERRIVLEGLQQPFAVYQFFEDRVVTILVSDGFCNLFGYAERDEAVFDMDNDMYKDTHPDDTARIANEAVRFATEGGKYDVVYRTRNVEGTGYIVVHAMGEHVYADDGSRLAHVWYTNEGPYHEESANAESEFARAMANVLNEQNAVKYNRYDYLTGLPTRSYFFEHAQTRKEAILKRGDQAAVLYFDFDGMAYFNKTHGLAQGDELLRTFSRILARAFGDENCCRIGADHFAAIAEETRLEEKLKGLLHEFEESCDGKAPRVHVGIYPYQIEDVHFSSACDRAKLVCKNLEGSYSSGFEYYDSKLREEAVMKQYIVENLDTALREKWVQVYFQPIIRSVNERVCDVEALARWVDPEMGVLTPGSFIPALEESGQIYKLDLYMVEQVLESIEAETANGIFVVSHSVNLSRIDFDACDIVEEIRKRVDAAGVARDKITIEVTESTVGSDLDFMKEQIERFQELGFPVWMDDFGSGYSSLDALQSIKFDLVKFDMSFMRKLDAEGGGELILTELMRMMTSLGLTTVCEGVETEPQVRFLQEIGCSKLQGFFFSEPLPLEKIIHLRKSETIIEHENPEETMYFESIGRVNLYDLGVLAQGDESQVQNSFNTLPMGIIEINGDSTRFVRSNQAYRDFIKRFFGFELSRLGTDFVKYDADFLHNIVKACCEQGQRLFFDERMQDGSIVHSFARQIGEDPVTGSKAVAIAVLSISEADADTDYADIARALAVDYYNIYIVDLDTDSYVEYSSLAGGEELALQRHGTGFFGSTKHDVAVRVYEKDRASFLARFSKENIIRELDDHGVFSITYRLVDTGEPVYVNMKITRLAGGNSIILGVSNIDAQMRQSEEEEKLRQEKAVLGRIAALSDNYIVLYMVDPVTGNYIQYNPSNDFEKFDLAKQGEDFFVDVEKDAPKAIFEEDLERHLRVLTEENMMRAIRETGFFTHSYRLMIDGEPVPVSLKAALMEEEDGEKIILGVSYARSDTSNPATKS